MMKVARNSTGKIVGYGPYEEEDGEQVSGYEPSIPEGGTVTIEEDAAVEAEVAIKDPDEVVIELKTELANLEREALMPRGAREAFIAMCEQQAAAAHKTKEQAYAENPFYKGLIDTNQAASALRTLIRGLS